MTTQPQTLEECTAYIQANGKLENYRSIRFDDGKYYRRVTVSAVNGKTTWTVTDYAENDNQDALSDVLCKLAKALYNAKQEGVV